MNFLKDRDSLKKKNFLKLGMFLVVFIGMLAPVFLNVGIVKADQDTTIKDPKQEALEKDMDCARAGGAGSMGWIVCPIIEEVGDGLTELYEGAIVPNLNIEPTIFGTGNDSATKGSWGIFRDIANVCFGIALMVVIFSQLTGVGIDNYGIKKILPKLIVVAILVNISYYLCLIAIDLSNILGNGLMSLFDQFTQSNIDLKIGENTAGGIGPSAIGAGGAMVVGIAILGLLVGAVALFAGGAIIMLAAVVGAFISLLFFFILLGVRKVGVVVAVIISPIAIICYALPNTKSLFKKWVDLMKGLLLLYPICGLIVGGGNYVSRLLVMTGDGSFWLAITAAIAGVAPIFFIPSALKSSLNVMGSIGNSIAGFGSNLKARARGRMLNSNLNKSLQQRGAERMTRVKANEKGVVGRLYRRIDPRGFREVQIQRDRDDDSIRRMNNYNSEAVQASFVQKDMEERTANEEAFLGAGKASYTDENKVEHKGININNTGEIAGYHDFVLRQLNNAENDEQRLEALAKVRAVQNIMIRNEAGRTRMKENYEGAISNDRTKNLKDAATHLFSEHGEKIKGVDRGFNEMVLNLASGGQSMNEIKGKVGGKEYDKVGIDKYTPESIARMDTDALKRLCSRLKAGAFTPEESSRLSALLLKTADASKDNKISLKGELEREIMDTLDFVTSTTPPTPTTPAP